MRARLLLYWLISFVAFTAGAFAQGVGASGNIKGTISDTTGAIMQNVAVVVQETRKGAHRTATTDSAGQYRVVSLPPAIYDISVAMPRFESQLHKSVALDVGETLIVDFHMHVSAN